MNQLREKIRRNVTPLSVARRKTRSAESTDSILGQYIQEIQKIPLLDFETEFQTAVKAKAGDSIARDQLVLANLRFVVTVARKYQCHSLSRLDLINEGNLGLLRAADRYNPDRGCRFISYAAWWIKQAILFALHQKSALIRLPLNRITDLRRLNEAKSWIEKGN